MTGDKQMETSFDTQNKSADIKSNSSAHKQGSETDEKEAKAGLSSKISSYEAFFAKTMDNLKELSGYSKTQKKTDMICLICFVIIGGATFLESRWYWGLAAGIIAAGFGTVFTAPTIKKEGAVCAEYFLKKLQEFNTEDTALLFVCAEKWAKQISSSHLRIKIPLMEKLEQHKKNIDPLLLEKAFSMLVSEHKIGPNISQSAPESDSGEDEPVENRMTRDQRRYRSIRLIDPDACLPVQAHQMDYHLVGVYKTFGSFAFSVSKKNLLMIPGNFNYEQTMIFPRHCIKSVTFSNPLDDISIDAFFARGEKIRTKKEDPVKITITLHIFLPIKDRSSCIYSSQLSFQIENHDWIKVVDEWHDFANEKFGKAPQCPVCGYYTLMGHISGMSEVFGLKEHAIRAKCSNCDSKVIFDPQRAVFYETK